MLGPGWLFRVRPARGGIRVLVFKYLDNTGLEGANGSLADGASDERPSCNHFVECELPRILLHHPGDHHRHFES